MSILCEFKTEGEKIMMPVKCKQGRPADISASYIYMDRVYGLVTGGLDSCVDLGNLYSVICRKDCYNTVVNTVNASGTNIAYTTGAVLRTVATEITCNH